MSALDAGAQPVGADPSTPGRARRVLITGGGGYVGRLLGTRLAAAGIPVVGTDLRARDDLPFPVLACDVRDRALAGILTRQGITHVVHLAAVLEGGADRARDHDIDVNGTRTVVECCLAGGVRHLTVSSSGAAYGYHADNPAWIDESQPLRATEAFAYAWHKRLVEELLAGYRASHPGLAQLVLRIGPVLGATTDNQITALFQRRRVLAVRGSEAPFAFIWDEDVVGAILHGVTGDRAGVFNVAGDGRMTIAEIARVLGKPVLALPAWGLVGGLWLARRAGVGRYGPEQVDFLRYRPVLSNRRLKAEFGYAPRRTSAEAFDVWVAGARARGAL
ncbi:MAG: SDR family oxidoreductase [Gemmatimonadaceae bacterium]|nr:SDR family oxidoreductase [Gemmatimonadaceae bacterium]